MQSLESSQREVRLLARASDRAGLATAYGHCSVRLDDHHFLVCAARPMGLIALHFPERHGAGRIGAVPESSPRVRILLLAGSADVERPCTDSQ